jgi:hypothetical protein
LGKAVATLVDFEVNPSITVHTCELVFIDELMRDVQDFDSNVFWCRHECVGVEVLKIDIAVACTFLQEYTFEEKLEQFQGCCVGTHIARVANVVANNGDSCVVRVVLVWLDFKYHHGMAYFLPLVQRDVAIVDAKECVGTGNTFEVGGLP